MTIEGRLDETFRLEPMDFTGVQSLIVDLKDTKLITSQGIAGWLLWLQQIPKDIPILFQKVPKVIVDQFNLVKGFYPKQSLVESFYIPYYCDACDRHSSPLVTRLVDFTEGTSEKSESIALPKLDCEDCKRKMEADVVEEKYFRFLNFEYRRKS